jgi:hypothetical protein
VASGVKCGPHGDKKSKTKLSTGAGEGNGSRPESARGVCDGSPENHQVTLLSHETKTGGSAGSGCAEKLRCRRTRGGITGLASGGCGLWRRRGRAMKRSAA